MMQELKEILGEYWNGDIAAVELDSVLASDMGLNSIELFDLVCAVEAKFNIEIPDRVLPKLITVRDLVEYLEQAA